MRSDGREHESRHQRRANFHIPPSCSFPLPTSDFPLPRPRLPASVLRPQSYLFTPHRIATVGRLGNTATSDPTATSIDTGRLCERKPQSAPNAAAKSTRTSLSITLYTPHVGWITS